MTENSGAHTRILEIVAEGVIVFATGRAARLDLLARATQAGLFPESSKLEAALTRTRAFAIFSFSTFYLKLGKG